MTITDLRESDAHTYSFRFYTDHPDGSFSGSPGVTLSVTDLKVTVSDTDGGVKKLTCSSTCTLPNNPTYIWYRNGQPVSDQNRNELELRDRTVDAGSYSCAVKGYEELGSPAVYSPRPPSVSETEVNGSVTLVCVSDSNPASSYTWFRKTGGNITQFGEGASLTLAAGADGVFYCTAENPYGSSTSSEWTLTSGVSWGDVVAFFPPQRSVRETTGHLLVLGQSVTISRLDPLLSLRYESSGTLQICLTSQQR
uniref:Ig-like domain-containing protein n=1 Tax=Pygocentrus nattereri TaxID=42514 RepID=A0AAR2LN87_PYGNA